MMLLDGDLLFQSSASSADTTSSHASSHASLPPQPNPHQQLLAVLPHGEFFLLFMTALSLTHKLYFTLAIYNSYLFGR